MSEFIVYASWVDIESIRRFINDDPDVAWIIKAKQDGCVYHWLARSTIESIAEQDYAIWHINSGPLNIPSGSVGTSDAVVADPFKGWSQTLDSELYSAPWFGGNLPGPFSFHFRESGKEAPNSLGRSGFFWDLDRYKAIGKPAHPDAKRWWQRLRRFLTKNTTLAPWPNASGRISAYVFPDAKEQEKRGRHRDVNP
jgi:hypothetical protein